ncbi:MAG: hypothetical protein OXU69_01300 [Gemmatimonadota bacterium]|nr:hypothetical protein [Gemmatimonadota bacterium]MDE2983312.1 hypothetical protein [Gemmatimonadota bacterium]
MAGGTPDHWRAVAPGRVNLIGEHTDYNGLPVLPIAIDRAIRVDFRVTGDAMVRLDSPLARFEPFAFQLKRLIEAADQGDWSNYVRAAARGLLEHGVELRRGIEGTVSGDVPIASGLSSSSALVVASALALLKTNGVEVGDGMQGGAESVAGPVAAGLAPDVDGMGGRAKGSVGPVAVRLAPDEEAAGEHQAAKAISRLELAALMARAERFVGLQGGGMDQAACLHGMPGHALRIEFEPLRVTPVAVPEGWRWVVASSLRRAEKSAGARDAYNERARQCREALEGVGGGYRDLVADDNPDGVLRRARRVLAPVLFRRFRHVVTEGRRVALAEEAMRNGEMDRFGELMVGSHRSLRDDYEVSTADLNEMVEIALEAGAAGARLTGAGFGGCIVALCDAGAVAPVTDALATRFYARRLGGPPGRDVMFAVKAGRGAGVRELGSVSS